MFDAKCYLDVLTADIEKNRGVKGYKRALAEAAGFEPSYLSRVLKGDAHLTPDHAFGIGEFWKLSEFDLEFFLTLVQRSRAGRRGLKARYEKKLKRLRNEAKEFKNRLASKSVDSPSKELIYYSTWQHAAIHMLTILDKYQSVDTLAKRLRISSIEVVSVLKDLERINLVQRKNDRWYKVRGSLHLDRDSRLTRLNHLNWRLRAMDSVDQSESLHFTSVYSLSDDAYQSIHELLLGTCQKIDHIVVPSLDEEIAVLCLDYFRC